MIGRIGILAVLLVVGQPVQAQSPRDAEGLFGSPSRFTEPTGAAIYQAVCTGCHMADGRGASGAGAYPSLVGDARLAASGYPVGVVLHGQRAMPSFARYLSDRQVADVVDFVRTHFGNAYADRPSIEEIQAAR